MSCSCDNSPLILPVGATGPQGPKGDPGFGFEHYIGEKFGGGVVFHVYKDADGTEHGLIVSITNQSIGGGSSYSDIVTSIGTSTTWDGQTNTNLMKAQVGATSGAWKDADDYSYDSFSDWYLPSIDQLNLLFNNRFNVNKTLSTIVGATQIPMYHYWSSTEDPNYPTNAWVFMFSSGSSYMDDKLDTFAVRAIRQF